MRLIVVSSLSILSMSIWTHCVSCVAGAGDDVTGPGCPQMDGGGSGLLAVCAHVFVADDVTLSPGRDDTSADMVCDECAAGL